MKINYFDCEYADCDERLVRDEKDNVVDSYWIYDCAHPNGKGFCNLENKWGGDVDDCPLLDKK